MAINFTRLTADESFLNHSIVRRRLSGLTVSELRSMSSFYMSSLSRTAVKLSYVEFLRSHQCQSSVCHSFYQDVLLNKLACSEQRKRIICQPSGQVTPGGPCYRQKNAKKGTR